MRLRQLSRKLDVDTEKVIHYLKASNLPCEDDSNAKLSDEQVELLIEKFGPIDEVTPEETETIVVPVFEDQEVVQEETIVAEEKVVEEEVERTETQPLEFASTPPPNQDETTPVPEVIRAPKVELTGLKVVGKIELRTPKQKEESEEETEGEVVQQPKVSRAKSNGRQRNQPRKNTLTIAEQRQREEKRKLRRKKEAEEQAKNKKRENYLKKVKAKTKTEAKKITIEKTAKPIQSNPTKKVGLITKFFNWMRRE